MSVRVLSKVLRESQSAGASRLVLIALADVASDDGEVTAYARSQSIIAMKANCSTSTVRKALRTLQEIGEVELLSDGGGRKSSDYRINLPGLRGGQIGGQGRPEAPPQAVQIDTQGEPEAGSISPSSSARDPSSSVSDVTFENFWQSYPKLRGQTRGSKQEALTAWRRLSVADHELAIAAIPHYTAANADSLLYKHASRFLAHRVFDDYQHAAPKKLTDAEKFLASVHALDAAEHAANAKALANPAADEEW